MRDTANPVAAQRSSLYYMSNSVEREQRLVEELEEPVLNLLRFLQVGAFCFALSTI